MNNPKLFVADMDDLQYRLTCGAEMVWAVHECINIGSCAPESYNDALYGAYRYLRGLCDEMREAIDAKRKANSGPEGKVVKPV